MGIVQNNENAEILFPTLSKYKDLYLKLLSNYLREYEDNTEKIFIELQIEHWTNYGNEFLENKKFAFNKYQIERLKASRSKIVDFLKEKLNTVENQKKKSIKDKTKENWFIIGVKFATGEIQKMLEKNEPPKVAEILGNKTGFRPYITSTIGVIKMDLKPKDKNIYTRKREDIDLILNYCNENNLTVCQDFKDKIKHIISD